MKLIGTGPRMRVLGKNEAVRILIAKAKPQPGKTGKPAWWNRIIRLAVLR